MLISLLHRALCFRYRMLGGITRVTSIRGLPVHYVEFQNCPAPVLFFVHGLGTSSSSWVNLFPHFKDHYHIVALDLPGFGLSPPPSHKPFLTIPEFDSLLREFVDAVLPEQFILIGHSLGGWLSMRLSAQLPERVSHLILMNTAGIFHQGVEEQKQLFTFSRMGDVRTLLTRMWYNYPWYFKPFLPAIYNDLQKRRVSEFVATIQEEDFVNDSLENLSMPVSLIWGKDDRLLSWQSVEILRTKLPHLRLRTIAHCGHVPQLEQPAMLKKILEEVLSEDDKRGFHTAASPAGRLLT
ncbi:MAG TPA: alpha/beta hydrolase [Bacteroidota bacterium]|nr:alpha/beta hydrolase [Bacteroidota bacterium]